MPSARERLRATAFHILLQPWKKLLLMMMVLILLMLFDGDAVGGDDACRQQDNAGQASLPEGGEPADEQQATCDVIRRSDGRQATAVWDDAGEMRN